MNKTYKNLILQFLFLVCSTIYYKIFQTNVYMVFVITFLFYIITNYIVKDIHFTFEYIKALVLISIVYTLGMFVTTPLMIYGLVLKSSCSILISILNEKQITNTIYYEMKELGLLKNMSLEDAYFEFELNKLEDVYFIFYN